MKDVTRLQRFYPIETQLDLESGCRHEDRDFVAGGAIEVSYPAHLLAENGDLYMESTVYE